MSTTSKSGPGSGHIDLETATHIVLHILLSPERKRMFLVSRTT